MRKGKERGKKETTEDYLRTHSSSYLGSFIREKERSLTLGDVIQHVTFIIVQYTKRRVVKNIKQFCEMDGDLCRYQYIRARSPDLVAFPPFSRASSRALSTCVLDLLPTQPHGRSNTFFCHSQSTVNCFSIHLTLGTTVKCSNEGCSGDTNAIHRYEYP